MLGVFLNQDDEVKTNFIEPMQHVLSKELKEIHVSLCIHYITCYILHMFYLYI